MWVQVCPWICRRCTNHIDWVLNVIETVLDKTYGYKRNYMFENVIMRINGLLGLANLQRENFLRNTLLLEPRRTERPTRTEC